MATIIREKSLGNKNWYLEKRASLNTKKPVRLSVKIADRFTIFPLRKRIVVTAAVVLLGSILVYCSTIPHLHPEKEVSTVQITSIAKVSSAMEKADKTRIPDLKNLNTILALDYPGDDLQGIFWKENDFGGHYYLSFDDGPNLERISDNGKSLTISESLLNSLKRFDAKAVFFINGQNLEYGSEKEKKEIKLILRRMIDEGHLLGNHSYHHHNLAQGRFADGLNDRQEIGNELTMTQDALDDILGFAYPMVLMRPPYAEPGRTTDLDDWLRQEHHYLISLQFDSYDYAYKTNGRWNGETIPLRIREMLSDQPDGGVLLMHELESTARFLPGLLDELINQKDYSFKSMEYHLAKKYGRQS